MSGTRPSRVSGSPILRVLGDSTRRSHASASSSAPPRQTPWICATTGLVISSPRFQASRQVAPERPQPLRRAAASRARRRPCRRRRPGRCRAGRRSGRTGRRRPRAGRRRSASTRSSLNALRFSGRLRTTWRTASRSSVMTRSDTADEAIRWSPMSLAGGLRELLRPPPHRGPLIAAGAVALGVGVALDGSDCATSCRSPCTWRCCSRSAG